MDKPSISSSNRLEDNETEQNYCLFNHETFLVIPVSTPVSTKTTQTTIEEFQNLSLLADHIPDEIITPIALVEADIYRSVVSVDSMVYCIGGSKFIKPGVHETSNEVTKFNACQPTCQPTFKLESCCNMIQPRVSPAVVSICGNIYVFGGLPNGKENCKECPWAEFLDTNEPESKQKWKAMKESVFRLLEPFAIQYEAQTILIGNSHDMNQSAIIYNVVDQSSLSYKFDEKTMSSAFVTAPVTIFSNKTMYWIDDVLFRAYELDTHIHYKASMRSAFPDFDGLFSNSLHGPILVHLKDDFFNMFTMFGNADSYPKINGIVECTKLRVTKCRLKSGGGVLLVDRVGHQSYQCESMWTLCGALPMLEPPMANEVEQNFCLFNHETFLLIPVSTPVSTKTTQTTLEEFQNLSLPAHRIPDEIITPIGLVKGNIFRSVVSVDSMVYCIGGSKFLKPGVHKPSNEVTKFNACQPTFKLESCCNMIQPRVSPVVVSIRGKIYVFGGIPNGEENCEKCPWAEFLDTNKPESKQKWKALKEPVSRLLKPLFAIQYEAQTILIGNSRDLNQGAIIYNVANQSSLSYEFDEKTMSCAFVTAPVTIFSNKTMYWIDDVLLRAYELDTHIHYKASMRAAFPDFDGLFSNSFQGPVLVHLKDDFFNMFTMFGHADSYPKITGIVECTKLQVTKCILKSGEGVLLVVRVGHQSYRCESMCTLCGALPM